jgi:putative transposase
MPGRAAKVIITERQQEVLQTMTRSSTCPQARAQRARMILLAFEGWSNEDIADRVGCERHAVGIWRRRWAEAFPRLVLIECCEKESALPHAVEDLLGDLPRSGCPGKFTAEQVTQVLAVACEPPEDSGRPVTHWTPRELADEVQKRGIVESISARHVGRFLQYGRTAAASQPLLAECAAGGPGGVSTPGRDRLRLLPGGPSLMGGGGHPYRQRR